MLKRKANIGGVNERRGLLSWVDMFWEVWWRDEGGVDIETAAALLPALHMCCRAHRHHLLRSNSSCNRCVYSWTQIFPLLMFIYILWNVLFLRICRGSWCMYVQLSIFHCRGDVKHSWLVSVIMFFFDAKWLWNNHMCSYNGQIQ